MTEQYAVLGKMWSRIKTPNGKMRVIKKAHIVIDGRSVCNAENAYKGRRPPLTHVVPDNDSQICKICRDVMRRNRKAKS